MARPSNQNNLKMCAISESWPTSMPVKRRRLKGSSTTPDVYTIWAKCMKVQLPWTGWNKSKNAESRSPLLRQLSSGKDQKINIIDTPGHVTSPLKLNVPYAFSMGLLLSFCSVSGVEPQSETVWRQADKYGVPRIAFVNKMDRTGADFFDAVKTMREKLHANAIPVHCPIGAESEFKGMVDLITMRASTSTTKLLEPIGKKKIFLQIFWRIAKRCVKTS